ncbi:MAG TPA: hypothetical protein VF884_15250 [Nitrososphaeraceae archaeon]
MATSTRVDAKSIFLARYFLSTPADKKLRNNRRLLNHVPLLQNYATGLEKILGNAGST